MTEQKDTLVFSLRKRTLMWVGGILLGVIIVVGLYNFLPRRADEIKIDPIAIEAIKVRRGSIVRSITVIGTLIAEQSVVVHPEIKGKIKKVLFEGGAFVKEETPLIEIEDQTYQAQVKDAEAKWIHAKAEYERATTLSQKNAGSLKARDKAYAELQAAEANLQVAKVNLANTIVRAPFEGVVSLRDVSKGEFVHEQKELLTIVDVDPIKIDFRLPATHLKAISVGQEIKVSVDGFQDKLFRATIESIDAKVDPNAHSIAVRARIPNSQGILKPGLFGRVRVVIGAQDDVLLVPESAVLSKADEEFVFRVVEVPFQGKTSLIAYKQFVNTGLSEAGNVEIVQGLKENDLVITIGQSKVRHGYPVRIVESDEEDQDAQDEDEEENEKK